MASKLYHVWPGAADFSGHHRDRAVAHAVAIDPAQKILQLLLLALGPFHLPGMGTTAGKNQSSLSQPKVALAPGNAALLGRPNQQNPGLVVKPGIGGIGKDLLLHRGIDVGVPRIARSVSPHAWRSLGFR